MSRGSLGRDAALIAALKLGVTLAVIATGFRAVSDDDFARVTIAEQWACAPQLDPTGTSWLPAPFWLMGAAMRLAGRSLEVARVTAAVSGVAAAILVLVAARWIVGAGEVRGAAHRAEDDARASMALAGAALAAVFPWSARLGAATVPELPAAALGLLGVASLVWPDGDEAERVAASRRVWGGLALLGATLSRYDGWPVAMAFALVSLPDLRRAPRERARLVAAAALALLGPAMWIGWNRHAHGDALHFLARVAAYRKALGGAEPGALSRLVAYPGAMLREEPELFAALALIPASAAGHLARVSGALRRFARPASLAVVQIAALSFAMIKDGAPTHHPERAVLGALLLAAIAAGALAVGLVHVVPSGRRVALGVAAIVALGAGSWVRGNVDHEAFTPRAAEVAAGALARRAAAPGDRVLLEVADYGYFAAEAAFGRPEDVELDRAIDPRGVIPPSSFDDPAALRARATGAGARFVLGRASGAGRTALGDPSAEAAAWALWRTAPQP